PGAKLLLAEPMAQTRGAMPVADAYFAMYLWAMGSGRSRRPDELLAMLREAGFARARVLRQVMPLQVRVLLAER
ncbi:MAG: methyltransferase, partial [Betaproteobacteria bacterium]|nr:methyltransferase [Betaproteobacteria bacterium]